MTGSKQLGVVLTALLVVVIYSQAACSPPPPQIAGQTHDRVQQPSEAVPTCPMRIEAADVVLTFVDGGAAYVFTSPTAQAHAIRQAARRLSALYDTELSHAEAAGVGDRRQLRQSPVGIPTRVEYSDLPAGARVEITAIYPDQVTSLQRRLRQEAASMSRTRQCNLAGT